ncbi:MAG TPA: outer membrane beta-barrel protein [Puia sp.]|jgi:hypothetical protein
MGVLPSSGQVKNDSVLPKVDSLKAVIVRPSELRPHLRGDTLEYNTSNIHIRLNANVEELLSRLPGLHISPDGTITYNGEVIRQLLVDGEDLFSSDPTLVTRNFDASKIAKVQILDRKNDRVLFTGIDDGSRTKTLNLVLKEDRKKGYFGKAETGIDPDGMYSLTGLLASFRGREQIAALGSASNTGSVGFSNNIRGASPGIAALGSNDPLGATAGNGIPRLFTSVLHYANSWNNTDNHLLANYQYGDLFTRPVTISSITQTLPDSIYTQFDRAQSVNNLDQHSGYGSYQFSIDSLSSLRFGFNFTHSTAKNEYSDTGFSAFNGLAVNRSIRSIRSADDLQNVGGSAEWRIRSQKKAGRIFSVLTSYTANNSNANGYLYSLNYFFLPDGELQGKDTVDQRKQITHTSKSYEVGLNLAQPVGKTMVVGLSYWLSNASDNSLQSSYGKDNGKYQDLIDSLSSHYKEHNFDHAGTFSLNKNSDRLSYTFSMSMLWHTLQQNDLIVDTLLSYNYFSFIPNFLLNYTLDPYTRFKFNYFTSSQQPTIGQLQPVLNNNDPLHSTQGNPALKPGFNQNWSFQCSRIKSWMLNLSLTFGITSNGISTKTITDSLGRQITQPVNADGTRNFGNSFSVNKKLYGINVHAGVNFNFSQSINYINTEISRNDSYTKGGTLTLTKFVDNMFSLQFSSQVSYISNQSSVNIAAPVHYWTQNHFAGLSLFFLKGFEINTYVNYAWQQKNSAFAGNTSVLLWNANINWNLPGNRLILKIQANNLLNQNTGISRINKNNINTETSTNILGRYWMLSLIYRFDHKYKRK